MRQQLNNNTQPYFIAIFVTIIASLGSALGVLFDHRELGIITAIVVIALAIAAALDQETSREHNGKRWRVFLFIGGGLFLSLMLLGVLLSVMPI